MTVCGMNNQCKVKEKRKARFPYRHPERSRGRVSDSEKRETPYRRKAGDGASRKRLSEGGGKRDLLLLEMREDIPEKSANI